MSKKQYEQWGVPEFMADPAFQEYVYQRGTDRELNEYWRQVRSASPQLGPVMEEAEDLLQALQTQAPATDVEGQQLVWKQVSKVMDGQPVITRRRVFRWQTVAAVLAPLVLLAAGLLIWHVRSYSPQVVATANEKGAFKLIKLPDSSQVMLGANSDIRYRTAWNYHGPREVWLKGDAHFEVKHLHRQGSPVAENEKFLVHVNDVVEIEVLGTVFNVWNRDGKTEVELESGKVKLRMKETGKEITLQPGEVATVSGKLLQLNEEKSDLVLQGPGHDKLYELNNTSVAEIIDMISGTYGKKVIVEDTALLSRRIDGVLPLCHEKDLLFALSGILDIRVRQTDAHTWVFSTAE